MAVETTPFDVAEDLLDEDRIPAFLEGTFAAGDPGFIASAIGDVARARNITAVARDTGLSRETLYQAFSPEGNPTLATMTAVIKALGFQLAIKPLAA